MKLTTLAAWGATLALAASAACATAPARDAAGAGAAAQEFEARIAGSRSPVERAARVARIVVIERPGGALEELAAQDLAQTLDLARNALPGLFRAGDDVAKLRVLDLYDRNWATLGQGVDFGINDLVTIGLGSRSADVRRAAARLAANAPLERIGNAVIDGATLDPSLTLAALLAVGTATDYSCARWVAGMTVHDDPRVREAARWAAARLGRDVAAHLRPLIDETDPVRQARALEGLLAIADASDLSLLQGWLARESAADPALRARISAAAGAIEANTFKPEVPARPRLEFFVPEVRPGAKR